MRSYEEIRRFRDNQADAVLRDHFQLNQLHDEIINQVIMLALSRMKVRHGPPPTPFSLIILGSAGRFEQSIWSDQDHGIIYQKQSDEIKNYFLTLGREISDGLHQAGYDYCEGGVMANNPLWCKSLVEWQQQIADWIIDSSWESIRYLSILFDGRSSFGEENFIHQLKLTISQSLYKDHLLQKFLSNTMYLKKGIGMLGQILVETHGQYAGSLNLKEKALFPYVNAARLLAMKGNIFETSTLARITQVPDSWITNHDKEWYKQQFLKLLNCRLTLGDNKNYESGHYLRTTSLSKKQKNEIKEILKCGTVFYQQVRKLIEKEDSKWE